MIGLDTNVLVRYITQDDPLQSPKATQLLESLRQDAPGFVSLVALIELVWVLSSCYDLPRAQLCQVLDTLLRTKEVVIDRSDPVIKALRIFKAGSADFADCLIQQSAAAVGCESTMTFDAAAAKSAGMTLIQ